LEERIASIFKVHPDIVISVRTSVSDYLPSWYIFISNLIVAKQVKKCQPSTEPKDSGFQNGEYEDDSLLGYSTV
jgi:hypothetical protein